MAKLPRFDSRILVSSLDRIVAWHRTNAPQLADSLSPGLSRSDIEAHARKRNIVLPEEVYILYAWRGGMRDGEPFFDVYRFLPLSEAFEYSDMLHENSPGEPYRLLVFQSILSNDAYYVECPHEPAAQAPVGFFLEGTSPEMDSLTTFVQAIAACFDRNVFAAGPDGLLEANEHELQRTLMDFRPRRKADIETLLRGEAMSLPLARQTQAYGDLVLIGHPRAEELISHGMSAWLYNREARFSTLLALARLRTPGALALLQRAAIDPDIEVRRTAYATLAWQAGPFRLAPEVEQRAISDLLAPRPELCDRREIARVLRWAPDTKPVPALIKALQALDMADPCARDTRIAIATALGQLGDRSAIPPLLNRLEIETDRGTQLTLASALADLGNAEGERGLRQRLEAMDENSLWNMANRGGSATAIRIAKEIYDRRKRP